MSATPPRPSSRRHVALLDGLDAPDMGFDIGPHDLVAALRRYRD